LVWIGYRRRWIGMVEEQVTSVRRYIKAIITLLQLPHHSADGYIDFLTTNKSPRFCVLREEDFSNKEVYGQSLKFLDSSVRYGTQVDIIIEGRTWVNKDKKLKTKHYVIKVE